MASLRLGSSSLQRKPICRPTAEVGTVALLSQLMAGLILAAAVKTRDQPVDLVARIREHVRTR
jgi:hypothetical protein